MITEIATFDLVAPADLSDATSPTTTTIRTFLTGITAAEGAHTAHFGQFGEKPETVVIFVDWDSSAAHKQFTTTDEYAKLRAALGVIVSTATRSQLIHVPAIPHTALGEHPDINVSEVVFFYFPSSLTPEDISAIMTRVDKLRPTMERSESLALFDGWAEETDVVNPNPELGGEKSRVWVNVVGWPDVAAHLRMQQSEDFAANIHHLMGIESIRGMGVYHSKLMKL